MNPENYLKEKWGKLFDFIDKDGDGILTMEDFMTFPMELLKAGNVESGIEAAFIFKENWDKVFELVNREKSLLYIGKEQWVRGQTAFAETEIYRSKIMKPLGKLFFDNMDTNGNGEISIKEWRQHYQKHAANEKYIEETFAQMDKNGDGLISCEEFAYAWDTYTFSQSPTDEDFSFLYSRPRI